MQCISAFVELGCQISIPFGEDSRYDFIADVNGKLYRIQCKTSSEIFDEDGEVSSIHFKTVRQSGSNASHWKRTKYTKAEIDFFATAYKKKCYLVPVEECSNEKVLRIKVPKNSQIKAITFLKDCELSEVLHKL